MKLGDLKPKGSDKTFAEWVDICIGTTCRACAHNTECKSIKNRFPFDCIYFEEIEHFINIEVEV